VFARFRGDTPNELQTRGPAFSFLINGGATSAFCDGESRNAAKPMPASKFETPPSPAAAAPGLDANASVAARWPALPPDAVVQNKDSHLLRQDSADLGPAPNVVTKSKFAYGVEAELFVNYLVMPDIEIGAGLRYWGLASCMGDVSFGPDFDNTYQLTNFDQERYGVLVHAKGRF
jgi:hypothetical protein